MILNKNKKLNFFFIYITETYYLRNWTNDIFFTGMDGWRNLQSVPQLKWMLCASGFPIMNDSDLAVCCLNMLIDICKFYPNRYNKWCMVYCCSHQKNMLGNLKSKLVKAFNLPILVHFVWLYQHFNGYYYYWWCGPTIVYNKKYLKVKNYKIL